jgi:hypothetical protein
VQLGDPPTPSACTRCGAPVDARAPFELRAHHLDDVIAGSSVMLLLLLATRESGVWGLADAMRPALAAGHGTFVVGRVNLTDEPRAPRQLGIERGPALAMYQNGNRLGLFVLPSFAAAAGDMLGKLLGPWATGAPVPGAGGAAPVFPFFGGAGALPPADFTIADNDRSDSP